MSDSNEQKDATTPKKGGFGAFADQYRDRWAANHPSTKKSPGDGAAPSTPTTPMTPAAGTDAGPDSTPQP
jgi:hypothetical protein